MDSHPVRMLNSAAARQAVAPDSPRRLPIDDGTDPNARLALTLCTLEAVWIEYTTGIGGNKAAKDFTRAE